MKSIFEENSKFLNDDGKKFEQDATNLVYDFIYEYVRKGYNLHELKFVFDSASVDACRIAEDEILHHFNNIKDPRYRIQLESIRSLETGDVERGECIGSDARGRVLLKQTSGYEPVFPYFELNNDSGSYWAIENKYKDYVE